MIYLKLLLLFGDGSVGKMTVGQELAKITSLRLFHNHMMIEPVIDVFGEYRGDTIARLRQVVFEDFAQTDQYGMIFTFMWAFDLPADWAYVRQLTDLFARHDAEIYYVELDAPLAVRLARNRTENRLQNKASKRDIARSDKRLLEQSEKYRCVSKPGEIPFANYLRIENTDLSAAQAAERIKTTFQLS